jgi:hypothetical protein
MTDGNAYAIDRYLASFDDEIGAYDGDTCNRFPEPDEDAPRGYRPRRCDGVMVEMHGEIVCDTCGELA